MRTLIAFIAGAITVGGLVFIAIAINSAFITKMDARMRSDEDYRLNSMRDYQ